MKKKLLLKAIQIKLSYRFSSFINLSVFSVIFLILNFAEINGQQWQCGQYVTRQVPNGGLNYKSQISILFNNGGTVGLNPICENTTHLWNAAVYYNGYIYAWKQYPGTTQSGSTSVLHRINSDCSVTTYNTNIPAGAYNNAYVDNDGNFYVGNSTLNSNIVTFTLYRLDLDLLTNGTNNATTIAISEPATNPFTNNSGGIGDMFFDGTNAYIC